MQTKRKTMTVAGAAERIYGGVRNACSARALADNDLAPSYARLRSADLSRDILARPARRLLAVRDSGSEWATLAAPIVCSACRQDAAISIFQICGGK